MSSSSISGIASLLTQSPSATSGTQNPLQQSSNSQQSNGTQFADALAQLLKSQGSKHHHHHSLLDQTQSTSSTQQSSSSSSSQSAQSLLASLTDEGEEGSSSSAASGIGSLLNISA